MCLVSCLLRVVDVCLLSLMLFVVCCLCVVVYWCCLCFVVSRCWLLSLLFVVACYCVIVVVVFGVVDCLLRVERVVVVVLVYCCVSCVVGVV